MSSIPSFSFVPTTASYFTACTKDLDYFTLAKEVKWFLGHFWPFLKREWVAQSLPIIILSQEQITQPKLSLTKSLVHMVNCSMGNINWESSWRSKTRGLTYSTRESTTYSICPNFLPSSSAKNSPNLCSQHSQLAKAAKKRTSKKHTVYKVCHRFRIGFLASNFKWLFL